MLIWYFSNNLDIYDYVGKLPEQHFSVGLFSNPGDNILFLLKPGYQSGTYVKYHISHVSCPISHVTFPFLTATVVELVGGGSLINSAYNVYLKKNKNKDKFGYQFAFTKLSTIKLKNYCNSIFLTINLYKGLLVVEMGIELITVKCCTALEARVCIEPYLFHSLNTERTLTSRKPKLPEIALNKFGM